MSRRAVAVWDTLAFPWAPLSVGRAHQTLGTIEGKALLALSAFDSLSFSFGFVSLHLNQGYIKMFEIPAGARHLLIQEADTTSHHLGECRSPDSAMAPQPDSSGDRGPDWEAWAAPLSPLSLAWPS